MNNAGFFQHFVSFCEYAEIDGYQDRRYLVVPVEEMGKPLLSADDCFKHWFLPRERELSFKKMICLFTWKEGYYPLWIKVIDTGKTVILRTNLRLRKAGANDDKRFYPFSIGE